MSEHATPVALVEDPDPRAPSTALVGAVGVLIVILIFIGLEVLYYKTAGAEFTRKEVESVPAQLEAVHADQLRLLEGGYRWVDKDAGTVGLPIERAMELVAEEYGSK